MLDDIIQTLNAIEVHGKNNLAMLLGCISALEDLRRREEKANGGQTN